MTSWSGPALISKPGLGVSVAGPNGPAILGPIRCSGTSVYTGLAVGLRKNLLKQESGLNRHQAAASYRGTRTFGPEDGDCGPELCGFDHIKSGL